MSIVIQLVGLVKGIPTEHDSEYVVEYEAHRRAENIIGAHLVTSADKGEALKFPTPEEAVLAWRQDRGTRPDGEPDRPLTAFTVQFLGAGEDEGSDLRWGDPHFDNEGYEIHGS
jgi:hypothetical protein